MAMSNVARQHVRRARRLGTTLLSTAAIGGVPLLQGGRAGREEQLGAQRRAEIAHQVVHAAYGSSRARAPPTTRRTSTSASSRRLADASTAGVGDAAAGGMSDVCVFGSPHSGAQGHHERARGADLGRRAAQVSSERGAHPRAGKLGSVNTVSGAEKHSVAHAWSVAPPGYITTRAVN